MKTKHTGKLFVFLLALVMMFGIMPMTVFAAVTPLATPTNLQWTGTMACWDPVTGASHYRVGVYRNGVLKGIETGVSGTSFDMTPAMQHYRTGTYTFTVTAVPATADTEHIASAESPESTGTYEYNPTITLATPINLRFNGTTAEWDAVPNAGNYDIFVRKNGALVSSTRSTGCSCDILSIMVLNGVGTYTFFVKANPVDTDVTRKSSDESAISSGSTGSYAYSVEPETLSMVTAAITVPAAGETPDYQPVSGNGDKYTVKSRWWRIDEQGIKNEMESEPFLAGGTYSATIIFTAREGYCFNDSTTAKVNGSAATRGFASSREQYYSVEFTVPAAGSPVSSFEIADLTAPAHGVAADYSASVTNTGFAVSEVRYVISGTDVSPYTGKTGDKLSIGIVVRANEGYTFTSDSQLTATCAGLTFIKAFKLASLADNERIFIFEYTIPAPAAATPVSDFEIANLTAPAHGVAADYSATVTNAGFTVTRIRYGIRTTGLTMVDPYTGKAGDALEIAVEVTKTGEATFASGSKATWNGIESTATINVGNSETVRTYVFKYTVPTPAHIHNFTGVWNSDATNHWQLCSCGDTGNVAAHSFGSWTVTKAATETAEGSRERTCSVCSYKQTEVIPKLSHTHSYTGTWKSDATNHWQLCSCGEKGKSSAHTYGAWKETKAATETATGSRERVCSVCGYKQTEVIAKLSHTHSYTGAWKSDATNHWQLCSCGEKGKTSAHTYGAWKETKAATETATGSRERVCSVCGYKQTEVIAKLSHTHSYTGAWKSDATNHWQLCSCGEKGKTSAHTYGAWKETKAATETATGSRERVCSVCGYKQTEVIPNLSHTHSFGSEWENDKSQHWNECDCGEKSNEAAHNFTDWTITKEATEAEEGLKTRTCSVCGYVESSVIPVLGHEHSYSEEWKSDSANHWNECDCSEKSNEAAHTFGEWATVKEATETEEGSKKRVCSVCGYEEYEAIPTSETVAPKTDTTDPESPNTETPETTEPTPSGSSPFDFSSIFSLFILIATIVLGVVIVGAVITVVIVIIVKVKKR